MRESHHMANVVIYRDKLSKAFDGQVMATYDSIKLLKQTSFDSSAGQISKIQLRWW